jgi:hypothetical protein
MIAPDAACTTDRGAASEPPESSGASVDSESSGASKAPEEELEPEEDEDEEEDDEAEDDVETASKPSLAPSTNPPSSPVTLPIDGRGGVVEQLAAQTVATETPSPDAVQPRQLRQLRVPRIAQDPLRAVTSRMKRYYRREWVRAVQLAAVVEVQR